MSESAASPSTTGKWLKAISVYTRPRVLIVMLLGFSAGLPLALTTSTLQAWLTQSGIDIKTIGLLSLVGLPYTFKFFWAPLVDALHVPLLTGWLGRRRGWLVLTQLLLIAAIALLGFADPKTSIYFVSVAALLVAAASATQDIVIDAFRVESLEQEEQAAGIASYILAYRVALLLSGAGALLLVSYLEANGTAQLTAWKISYIAAAVCIVVGLVAAFLAKEPESDTKNASAGESPIARVYATAYSAFSEFLSRKFAVIILVFVLLFKFCDAFAGVLTVSFVLKIGFSLATYAAIVKGVGFAAAVIGGLAGGALARSYSLTTCLWIAALVQMLSNLMFSWLAWTGPDLSVLTATIIVENFTSNAANVIFVAYLSALCGVRAHTATQFALLSAIAAVGRTVLAAGGGYVADATGWFWFFIVTALSAIPSILLLWWLQRRGHFAALEAEKK
ncbi:MAG: MFS transporter [Xanthobacteraceae bacterium]|nr:MFS transporter [Xanthobacteraceae bacterium]MBX3524201.1 MFS transporter [Xanthobacteraceae bacterium]MCW5673579.1 MFS transporter [Xanthobacteraceae bacterium]